MALSNLRNEPRREITEQVAGLVVLAAHLFASYAIVLWLGAVKTADVVMGTILCAAMIPALLFFLFMLSIIVHGLGEAVCARLARFGIDPRPRERYRR